MPKAVCTCLESRQVCTKIVFWMTDKKMFLTLIVILKLQRDTPVVRAADYIIITFSI